MNNFRLQSAITVSHIYLKRVRRGYAASFDRALALLRHLSKLARAMRDLPPRIVLNLLFLIAALVAAVPGAALISDRWFGTEIIERVVTRNRGDCRAQLELSRGEFCTYPGSEMKFRVTEVGAFWADEGNARVNSINLPEEKLAPGHTFQALELNDGRWRILAAGPWLIVGNQDGYCERGAKLGPGHMCLLPLHPPMTFRVYGVRHPRGISATQGGYAELVNQLGGTIVFDPQKITWLRPRSSSDIELVTRIRATRQSDGLWAIEEVGWSSDAEQGRNQTDMPPTQVQNESQQGESKDQNGVRQGPLSPEGESNRALVPSESEDDNGNVNEQHEESELEKRKNALVEKLFAIADADLETYHDYADFGAERRGPREYECDGYIGGYASWRVQTKTVAGDDTAEEEFFSLTVGEVIVAEQGEGRGIIGVWDEAADRTTFYVSARRSFVELGDMVGVGDRLGIQGGNPNLFGTRNEGVQIQVREGKRVFLTCGRDGNENGLIWPEDPDDPIDPIADSYLYESVIKASP